MPRATDVVSPHVANRLRAYLYLNPDETQASVARKAGVSTATISLLLNKGRGAGAKTMRGIAEFLGMTWADLEQEANNKGAIMDANELPRPNNSLQLALREQEERRQDRRDRFAAAALGGLLADQTTIYADHDKFAKEIWRLAEAMMANEPE
jgi:transcriptional regulator with XRE-family HTH domain